MSTASKKNLEVFILPDGVNLSPSDTYHKSYLKSKPLSALGSDVKLSLETVFNSQFSIGREDMENLLRVLSPTGQKKALRGYFYKMLGESGFNDIHTELERMINSFPTGNWTDENWQSFGSLAPKNLSQKPKISTRPSDRKPRNRYLAHDASFRAIVAGYEGSYDSLDGRGHR